MKVLEATEAQFQNTLIELARLEGWTLVHHCRPAMKRDGTYSTAIQGNSGFVDLVLVGAKGVLFIECKRRGAKPTLAQRMWLDQLSEHRSDRLGVYCWSPDDWTEIEMVLRSGPWPAACWGA